MATAISNTALTSANQLPLHNVTDTWKVNSVLVDTNADEVAKTSAGSGYTFAIDHVYINSVVNATVIVKEEGDAQQIGPFNFLAAGPDNVDLHFDPPWILTEDKDIEIDHGTAACTVILEGRTITI